MRLCTIVTSLYLDINWNFAFPNICRIKFSVYMQLFSENPILTGLTSKLINSIDDYIYVFSLRGALESKS